MNRAVCVCVSCVQGLVGGGESAEARARGVISDVRRSKDNRFRLPYSVLYARAARDRARPRGVRAALWAARTHRKATAAA